MRKIVIILSIVNLAVANAQLKTGDALPNVQLNNNKDVCSNS
jgi:hypothetical protein